MFRVKDSDFDRTFALAGWAIRLTLILALAAACASAYLILREYDLLEGWRNRGEDGAAVAAAALESQVRLQLICILVVAATLLLGGAIIWRLRRGYFSSQRSLRQVKMLAHDILASMDQGVITADPRGTITSINSAGIRLLGVDFECVGRPLASVSSTDVPLIELYRQVGEGRGPVRDRDFAIVQAGRLQRLRADAHGLTDARGDTVGCVIHLRDVTGRVLMEERMRRMERFLSLATLASGLHHEIKNPLTALSIHIQLLEERLATPGPGEPVEELVGVVKSEVVRLNGVLESFRNFANLQRLTVQPADVPRILENTLRLVAPQAARQHVQITQLPPGSDLPPVPLDADKVEQAVLNLVLNALEAMPSGGALTLGVDVCGGSLRIAVTDTGPGIPPEVQKHLFEPYFSTKDHGTGMGLALSEKLISQHGGRIDYTTGRGGTTFAITLPLEQGSAAHE